VNHEYATIVAPNDGVVLSRAANPGQMVGPGTAIIQFASRGRGNVLRAGVPDREAVRVAIGDPAEVGFAAVPGKVFKGKVSQVAAAADPRTGLFVVEIALEGAQALPSGLVGRVAIAPAERGRVRVRKDKEKEPPLADAGSAPDVLGNSGGVFAIPAAALVEGDKDHGTVFTVDASGTRARKINVELVGLAGDQVLVRGLGGVTRVVRSGATWLTDSARVEIKP
jgi:multidrug efflux system membrane fusion protein